MIGQQGWLPYDERMPFGQRLTDEFHERIKTWSTIGSNIGDVPDIIIPEQWQIKHLGKVLPRLAQVSGSCVGVGGAQSYLDCSFFDWLVRDDEEELKPCCPWPTYGVGRFIAFRGRGGPGEGSFGAAQQEAVSPGEFGMLPFDDPRMPQPTIKHGNWWYWTRQDEIGWSWSPRFPIPRDELEADSKQYGVHAITRIKNADEWIQAIAAGKAITLASMFGTRARVEGDVLLGRWNGSWAHQMSSNGYWLKHERHGDLIKINNQWGPNAHGKCPTLSKFDCTGSFWILRKDADRICRTGEVYAHSATGGFEAAEGLWVW